MAAALKTRPFLALRIPGNELTSQGRPLPAWQSYLFVVSTKKPTGLCKDCYFALEQATKEEKRTLVVNPPLPSHGRPLFIHTVPCLCERLPLDNTDASTNTKDVGLHVLEESSFRTFCSLTNDHREEFLKQKKLESRIHASSGGDELVGVDWETWSGGHSAIEYLNKPFQNKYDQLEFKDLPVEEPPSIFQELALYEQSVFSSERNDDHLTIVIGFQQTTRGQVLLKPSHGQNRLARSVILQIDLLAHLIRRHFCRMKRMEYSRGLL